MSFVVVIQLFRQGNPTIDILSYACKVYQDSMAQRKQRSEDEEFFDFEDILERGQDVLLEKLSEWNNVVPVPRDDDIQHFVPAVNDPQADDEEAMDHGGEAERLYGDGAEDFWGADLNDL